MTHRERMLAVLAGAATDRIPWVPRLDLWYRANALAGSLPPGLPRDTLPALVDALDWGFHAVVPDFRDLRGPEDDADRALGIYNLHFMPYRTAFPGIARDWRRDGDLTHVAYRTPEGTARCSVLYNDAMRRAGISITHVAEPVIKSLDDFRAVGALFRHARVLPNYEGYADFARGVGDRGVAVGFVSLAASPMHLIMRELMPMEAFFYAMHDYPEALARLADDIAVYWEQLLAVAVASPAEILLVGANYDASVTYPPFFAAHIAPWLQRFADALHARGKYLLTHTDGENTGLLPHYLASRIDIADSVCPAPMTKLSLRDVRRAFDGRIAIMGGIPSVALLPSSMADDEFDAFLDDFFRQLGRGDRLILGISDTTPPAADFDRLRRIADRIAAFAPAEA